MTIETVDAEIKVNRALTESGVAENPQNAAHINGPQRAWNKALVLVFHDVEAYVSCTEYVCTR